MTDTAINHKLNWRRREHGQRSWSWLIRWSYADDLDTEFDEAARDDALFASGSRHLRRRGSALLRPGVSAIFREWIRQSADIDVIQTCRPRIWEVFHDGNKGWLNTSLMIAREHDGTTSTSCPGLVTSTCSWFQKRHVLLHMICRCSTKRDTYLIKILVREKGNVKKNAHTRAQTFIHHSA